MNPKRLKVTYSAATGLVPPGSCGSRGNLGSQLITDCEVLIVRQSSPVVVVNCYSARLNLNISEDKILIIWILTTMLLVLIIAPPRSCCNPDDHSHCCGRCHLMLAALTTYRRTATVRSKLNLVSMFDAGTQSFAT